MNSFTNIGRQADIAAKVAAIMADSRARFGHGHFEMNSLAVVDRLEAERREQEDFIEHLLNKVDEEKRDLVDAETSNLTAAKQRIAEIDKQLKPLREFLETRDAHRATGARPAPAAGRQDDGDQARGLGARTELRRPDYRSAGEFLADGFRAATRGDETARHRLESEGVRIENGVMVRAAAPHNTTAEVPGLLPVTIQGQIMSDVDAARPFISSVGAKDLGGIPGTSFNRPTVTEHVQVGKQSAEKAELPDGQFKVGSVPFTKDTYGGWANVSRQNIDWTSPAVWDALMADFMEQYALQTENAAADAFATAVTAETDTAVEDSTAPTVQNYLSALYAGASAAYSGSGRLPDTIWVSLDVWASMGPLIDALRATTAGNGGGDSSASSFAGNLLSIPRIVVPSFPAGTFIVGVKSRTEVYEDRIGFLSAVEPKVLGVELAYGGYMASGTIKPAAFSKVTFTDAV